MKHILFTFLALVWGVQSMAQEAEDMDIKTQTITLAGGCFWCMQSEFEELDGVVETKVGYSGGNVANPTYKQVSAGDTGHVEAILIRFEPEKIKLDKILDIFWSNVDPTDDGGQFCDRGEQYRAGLFYTDDAQKAEIEKSIELTEAKLGQAVKTFVRAAKPFYEAEEYHQNYYKKNPLRYKFYKYNCGREQRLKDVWGDSEQ